MRTLHAAAVGVVLVTLVADPVAAQERMELVTVVNDRPRIVNVDIGARAFGEILAVTPVNHVVIDNLSSSVPVAGARYLAWVTYNVNGTDLGAFDRRTRQVVSWRNLLPPQPASSVLLPSILATDSRRPRLFIRESTFGPGETLVWLADLRGAPPVQLLRTRNSISTAAYAADADELFLVEHDPTPGASSNTVVVLNASSGREIARWPKPTTLPLAFTVEPGGRVAWIDHGGLTAVDAHTGAVLARNTTFSVAHTQLDAERRLLYARLGDFLAVLDPLTLTELGRARVDYDPPQPWLTRATVALPGRGMTGAYLLRVEYRNSPVVCNAIAIDAFDPAGAHRATVDVARALGPGTSGPCSAIPFMFRAPRAPTGMSASVAGAATTLAWNDPGDTTEFELEYGFAPGQRAGTFRVGAATQLAIPGVPPGAYYVRVTALNEVGSSPASNEIRVVVP